MGGTTDESPTLSLCGVGNEDKSACHGAAHHQLLSFRWTGESWKWSAKEEYVKVLNRRHKALKRLYKPGLMYPIMPIQQQTAEEEEKLGEILNRAESILEEHRSVTSEAWREDAELLWLMVWEAVKVTKGAEARDFFKEWAAETGVSGSTLSKMKKVVTTLPRESARDLPWTKQYNLARVWEDVADTQIAYEDAYLLSVSDFAEKYGLKKDPTEDDRLPCPTCGGSGKIDKPVLDENFCDEGGHFDMEAAMEAADYRGDE